MYLQVYGLESWWRQYSSMLYPLMFTDNHNMSVLWRVFYSTWLEDWVGVRGSKGTFTFGLLSPLLFWGSIFQYFVLSSGIFLTHGSVTVRCLTQMTTVTTSRNWKDNTDPCKAVCLYWVLSPELDGKYIENAK